MKVQLVTDSLLLYPTIARRRCEGHPSSPLPTNNELPPVSEENRLKHAKGTFSLTKKLVFWKLSIRAGPQIRCAWRLFSCSAAPNAVDNDDGLINMLQNMAHLIELGVNNGSP